MSRMTGRLHEFLIIDEKKFIILIRFTIHIFDLFLVFLAKLT